MSVCWVQMSTDCSNAGVACLPKGIGDVLVERRESGYGRSVDVTFCQRWVSHTRQATLSSARYKCHGVVLQETLIVFSIEHDVMKNS